MKIKSEPLYLEHRGTVFSLYIILKCKAQTRYLFLESPFLLAGLNILALVSIIGFISRHVKRYQRWHETVLNERHTLPVSKQKGRNYTVHSTSDTLFLCDEDI